jgi:hypothetical protein
VSHWGDGPAGYCQHKGEKEDCSYPDCNDPAEKRAQEIADQCGCHMAGIHYGIAVVEMELEKWLQVLAKRKL